MCPQRVEIVSKAWQFASEENSEAGLHAVSRMCVTCIASRREVL